MKTKHMLSILSLVLVVLLGIYSCKKEQANNSQPISFVEKIAADESFMKLNNAMNRFDPQYMVLVYHDARTPKEISDASVEILKKLGEDPNNQTIQKELAGFYHFNSVAEFSMYSNNISEGIQELNTKFNFTKEVTENNKAGDFLKARILYATNEYNKLVKSQSGPHRNLEITMEGVPDWQDYTDQLIDFYRYSMNQGFHGNQDYGSDNGCNGEKCCIERANCKLNAYNTFWDDFAKYGGGGAAGGATTFAGIGGGIGSAFLGIGAPFGAGIGGLFGFLGGGLSGLLIAKNIYTSNIEICNNNYQLCKSK